MKLDNSKFDYKKIKNTEPKNDFDKVDFKIDDIQKSTNNINNDVDVTKYEKQPNNVNDIYLTGELNDE